MGLTIITRGSASEAAPPSGHMWDAVPATPHVDDDYFTSMAGWTFSPGHIWTANTAIMLTGGAPSVPTVQAPLPRVDSPAATTVLYNTTQRPGALALLPGVTVCHKALAPLATNTCIWFRLTAFLGSAANSELQIALSTTSAGLPNTNDTLLLGWDSITQNANTTRFLIGYKIGGSGGHWVIQNSLLSVDFPTMIGFKKVGGGWQIVFGWDSGQVTVIVTTASSTAYDRISISAQYAILYLKQFRRVDSELAIPW